MSSKKEDQGIPTVSPDPYKVLMDFDRGDKGFAKGDTCYESDFGSMQFGFLVADGKIEKSS